MLNEILTPEEVADILGCSVQTVNERAANDDLPGVKYGISWRFPRDALLKRLNEQALAEKRKRREPTAFQVAPHQPKSRRRPLPKLTAVAG